MLCSITLYVFKKNDLRGLIVDESHVFLFLVSTPPGNYFVLFWGACIAPCDLTDKVNRHSLCSAESLLNHYEWDNNVSYLYFLVVSCSRSLLKLNKRQISSLTQTHLFERVFCHYSENYFRYCHFQILFKVDSFHCTTNLQLKKVNHWRKAKSRA